MSAIDVGAGDGAKSEKRESKTLSDLVAVTVVILSVFMAISKTKDDNINQAMQKAKAELGRCLGGVPVRPREAACRRERAEPAPPA